jgi:hypothetical protein
MKCVLSRIVAAPSPANQPKSHPAFPLQHNNAYVFGIVPRGFVSNSGPVESLNTFKQSHCKRVAFHFT